MFYLQDVVRRSGGHGLWINHFRGRKIANCREVYAASPIENSIPDIIMGRGAAVSNDLGVNPAEYSMNTTWGSFMRGGVAGNSLYRTFDGIRGDLSKR